MTLGKSFLLSVLFVLSIISIPANAIIVQEVGTRYTPSHPAGLPSGTSDFSIDRVEGTAIDRAVFARVSDTFYTIESSAGKFGNFGVSGSLNYETGAIAAHVFIGNGDFKNRTGQPQQATANFVIDGGLFTLLASPSSTVGYKLKLELNGLSIFESSAELEAFGTSEGLLANRFTQSGDDIGTSFDGGSSMIIPLSFQSVDLGLIGLNERFALSYTFEAYGVTDSFAERIAFEFSDPLNVEFSENPLIELTFSGPVSSVPVPGALPLLLTGLGFLFASKKS